MEALKHFKLNGDFDGTGDWEMAGRVHQPKITFLSLNVMSNNVL